MRSWARRMVSLSASLSGEAKEGTYDCDYDADGSNRAVMAQSDKAGACEDQSPGAEDTPEDSLHAAMLTICAWNFWRCWNEIC
jgi:hypothetical protein